MAHRLAPLLVVATLCACRGENDPPLPRAAPSTSRPAPEPTARSSAAGRTGKGLDAPDNDKEIVALAKKAAVCRWEGAALAATCPELRAWTDAKDPFVDGRGDPTLVALLEDPDEKARTLAATKLAAVGVRYRTARALAERVVAVGEGEKSARVAPGLGEALGRVDVEETQLFERIRALALRSELVPLRAGLTKTVAFANPGSLRAFELTRDQVKDPAPEVRLAAVEALWWGGGPRPQETCAFWAKTLDSRADDAVAARSAKQLTWWGRCQAHYDALLDLLERRQKAGEVKDVLYTAALTHLCDDRKATEPARRRAAALAAQLADGKTADRLVRGGALEAVLHCDRTGGKATVRKYAADDDSHVRARATDLLKP